MVDDLPLRALGGPRSRHELMVLRCAVLVAALVIGVVVASLPELEGESFTAVDLGARWYPLQGIGVGIVVAAFGLALAWPRPYLWLFAPACLLPAADLPGCWAAVGIAGAALVVDVVSGIRWRAAVGAAHGPRSVPVVTTDWRALLLFLQVGRLVCASALVAAGVVLVVVGQVRIGEAAAFHDRAETVQGVVVSFDEDALVALVEINEMRREVGYELHSPEPGETRTFLVDPLGDRIEDARDVADPTLWHFFAAICAVFGAGVAERAVSARRAMRRLLDTGGPTFHVATTGHDKGLLLASPSTTASPLLLLVEPLSSGPADSGDDAEDERSREEEELEKLEELDTTTMTRIELLEHTRRHRALMSITEQDDELRSGQAWESRSALLVVTDPGGPAAVRSPDGTWHIGAELAAPPRDTRRTAAPARGLAVPLALAVPAGLLGYWLAPHLNGLAVLTGALVAAGCAFGWSAASARPVLSARERSLVISGGVLDEVVPWHRVRDVFADDDILAVRLQDPSEDLVFWERPDGAPLLGRHVTALAAADALVTAAGTTAAAGTAARRGQRFVLPRFPSPPLLVATAWAVAILIGYLANA